MGRLIYIFYNLLAVPLMYVGFAAGSLFNRKIKKGWEGRRSWYSKIRDAMASVPDGAVRVCCHCTSVGEWEQAVPVLEKLKKDHANLFVMVSFFSSSGYEYAKAHPSVDLKIYLPIDSWGNAQRLFRLLRPSLWVISKFDIWPNHMIAAGKMGIPIVMIDATLSADSGRDKGLMKPLSRFVYRYFDFMFPISEEDQARFLQVFPFPDRMQVTGDTRFDQVHAKGTAVQEKEKIELFEDNSGLKIIAGSIWPADEKHVMPAFVKAMQKYDHLKLILVPHELHESHLADIESALSAAGLESERYSRFADQGKTKKNIAIVDTIGMLALLYKDTDLAYVGGSFDSGVHNVMEPAVFGQPVIFGPKHLNSFEAMELIKVGSAFEINNAREMEQLLDRMIGDDEARKESGRKASDLILGNLGATEKIVNQLKKRYEFLA